MNTDFSTLCEKAEAASGTVLENLSQIESALGEVQGKIAGLPFFVRGFVSSEVKRGTGQDIPAWQQVSGALISTVRDANAAVARAKGAGAVSNQDRGIMAQASERVEAERPRLEALAGYMQQAPSKIQSVPGGMIPAAQRDEILGAIDRQTQALRGAVAVMPDLAQSLAALSGRAA